MKVRSYYPTTIQIDDPDTGELVTVRVRIKRLTLEQASRFKRDFYRSGNPPTAALLARTPDRDEQAKTTVNGVEQYVLPADVIRARRLAEMSDAERAELLRHEDEEEQFSIEFLAGVIRDYVSIEDGQLYEDVEGGEQRPIISGEDVLRVYGGRSDVLRGLLWAVFAENTLDAAAKKASRSLFDSARSSDARPSAAPGPTPAPTAADAGTAASAATEDARDPAASPSSCSSDAPAMVTPASSR